MTTEEKLQHFYDAAVKEAHDNADRLLKDYEKELGSLLEEHKKEKDQEIALTLKTETDQASREVNRILSSQLLEIKREGSKRHEQYKDKIFQEVLGLLEEFRATDAYEDYLKRKIQEALNFAEKDPVTFYLSQEDSGMQTRIAEATGVDIKVTERSFLGGIQAEIPDKNILIDSSFLEAYRNEKSNFTFDGGLTYE